MAALPYMPLYVSDYLADAAHLSTMGHGAYLLLIMTYWQRGEPLPDDDRKLARIARVTDAEWSDLRDDMADFFSIGNGRWSHKRIDKELEAVRAKSEQARSAGRSSVERRLSARSTDAERPLSERSTPVERALNDTDTDTDTEKEITPLSPPSGGDAPLKENSRGSGKGMVKGRANAPPAYTSEFEIFWDCYPKVQNQSKQKAFEAFHRLDKPDKGAATDGAMALERKLQSDLKKRPDAASFIPHAATWLNQRRWETLVGEDRRKLYEERSIVD